MPDTLCRKCGTELEITHDDVCPLCELEISVVCPSCGHIPDSKVHADCRTAVALVS
jgi:hypothetical protein